MKLMSVSIGDVIDAKHLDFFLSVACPITLPPPSCQSIFSAVTFQTISISPSDIFLILI